MNFRDLKQRMADKFAKKAPDSKWSQDVKELSKYGEVLYLADDSDPNLQRDVDAMVRQSGLLGPLPQSEIERFGQQYATFLRDDLIEEALDLLDLHDEGLEVEEDIVEWKQSIRNSAEMWGYSFDKAALEEGWWLLLRSAVETAETANKKRPQITKTRPDESEMTGERVWVARYPAAVNKAHGCEVERVYAFYDTGWYSEANIFIRPGAPEDVSVIHLGRYEEGDGVIETTMTEHNGQPIALGPPYILKLDERGGFVYADMYFNPPANR